MYIIAVHSLIRVESRSSACMDNREFADIRFNLFVVYHFNRVSFPIMIHLRFSCNERFIPSTKPLVQGA